MEDSCWQNIEKNIDCRILEFVLNREQLKEGQPYNYLKKTITINILDFNYIGAEKYSTVFHLWEDSNKNCKLTDVLEIRFLELPKFRKAQPDMSKPLDRWMVFIEDSPEEVLEMAKREEPAIARAEEVLKQLGSSPSPIVAGEEFLVKATLKNTSDEESVQNMTMTAAVDSASIALISFLLCIVMGQLFFIIFRTRATTSLTNTDMNIFHMSNVIYEKQKLLTSQQTNSIPIKWLAYFVKKTYSCLQLGSFCLYYI